jgi:glycosyltransferase involved in cell wall biosynthesis
MPLVSAIIPVYNGEAFLAEAIGSALAQDYPNFEVIVADDGSTDRSRAIAEGFPGVSVLALAHAGVSATRNAAVRAASGEWLAFLDADDVWSPGKLSAQVQAARAKPEAGLVFTHQTFVVAQPAPPWYRGPEDGVSRVGLEPSSWLVRRQAFELVGPFDEQRDLGEDTEWIARARDAGVVEAVVEESLVRRRIHGDNATGTIPSQLKLMRGILRESVARKRAKDGAGA